MTVRAALSGRQHPDGLSRVVRGWQAVALAGLAFFFAHVALGAGGHAADDFVNRWLYDGLEVLAAAGCGLRALGLRAERAAWLSLTLGIGAWTLGDITFDFAYGADPPFPSVADAFYLAFYPCCYVAVALLVRARVSSFNRSLWLDGATAALASAALGAAVLFEVVLEHTHGSAGVVGTNLAYPVGDLLLLALVVGVFAITGWRPGRTWLLLGAAFALSAIADGVFLYQTATNTYAEGRGVDLLWPTAMLMLAFSAWQAAARRPRLELRGRPLLATPMVCGIVALGVLVDGYVQRLNALSIGLAGAAILAVILRTGLTFRENSRILAELGTQAVTDALTGLGNRRRLMTDLEQTLDDADEHEARMLIIFDLDGFKSYNDTFGHPAGDALLARLGAKLAQATAGRGSSYRLGGDEFCVLALVHSDGVGALLDATVGALSEDGEGFAIRTSFGAVFVPDEATEPSEALRIADQRLYAQKHATRLARGQPHEVLLQAIFEREPDLRHHVHGVAELSVAVGRRLSFDQSQLEELRLAAELHDVGKLAVPDEVLRKPGPLDGDEWHFIRQHPVVGERILNSSPALQNVGRIVRASHERWDGRGYVDGLAGTQIPLAARIIAVCDAFCAMIAVRPYSRALSSARAIEELRRCAGSQFDPAIVEAVCCELTARPTAELSAKES